MHDFQETIKYTHVEWHLAHSRVKHVSSIRFCNSRTVRLSLLFFKQCIIKQLLNSVFVILGVIKVSVSVISLSLQLQLITLTETLIIPDITKTKSSNCCHIPTHPGVSLRGMSKFPFDLYIIIMVMCPQAY